MIKYNLIYIKQLIINIIIRKSKVTISLLGILAIEISAQINSEENRAHRPEINAIKPRSN